MSALQPLENSLDDLFVKQAPELPLNGKKALVQYLPWISLFLGLISLWTVYVLWHWAHLANNLINYANSISAAYGGPMISNNRLSFGIWVGLTVLAVEALLYIAAYPGLRDRKKSGWDLLFYGLIINVVYGVVIAFTSYGGVGNLIWTLLGSAIGFYFLFQIRGSYKGARAKAGKKP
jgi:hypothetical protein